MRIHHKLSIVFLTFIAITVGLISYAVFYNSKKTIEREIASKLNAVLSQEAEEIETFFSGRKSGFFITDRRDIEKAAYSVLNQFSKDRSNPAYIEDKKTIDGRLAIPQKMHKYTDIKLINMDGRIVYVFNPENRDQVGHFIVDKDAIFQEVITGIYVEGIRKTTSKKYPNAFYLATPVYGDTDKIVGLIYAELDMSSMYKTMQDNPDLGKSGETLLVMKAPDNKVMFASPLKYDTKAVFAKTITMGAKNALPAQAAARGESGSGPSIDYRGKAVLSAWRPLPSLGLGLVSKVDSEEAFLPIKKLKNLLIIVILVSIFSTAFVSLAIAKSITNPIDVLYEGVEIIGSGNLDYKVGTDAKDEVGQLSRAFDTMTANLRKSTVSIEELNKEITERKRTENDLERKTLELDSSLKEALKSREILTSMLDDNNQIKEELEVKFEELKQAQSMLVQSEKLASLGKLVADMAHEVNNPLMIISGNAQLSLLEPSLSEEVKNNLRIIFEECNRAKSIIQRLLMFSRPSKGEQKPVDINMSIGLVVGLLEHQYSLSNVKVNMRFSQGLSTVTADDKQLQEVFMNLLNNARDAMPGGGAIDISTFLDGEYIKIEIKDSGMGMDKKTLSRLFEPFFTTKEKGTGLGLAMCYGIIKAHNGKIELGSQPQTGTTAHIWLPLAGGGSHV